MEKNNQRLLTFFRKNANYIIFLFCLAAITAVTIILVVNSNNDKTVQVDSPKVETPVNPPSEGDGDKDNGDSDNVASVIVFTMPVSSNQIIKDYVDNSVVYNQTLGNYSGHKAIDFAAEEGSNVFACYGGTVKSIEESKLEGVTVTIDHGNGLVSLYNGLEVLSELTVGKQVEKGEVIGTILNNNRTEYKDGPHLHFEVKENDKKVNPNKYLLIEEK